MKFSHQKKQTITFQTFIENKIKKELLIILRMVKDLINYCKTLYKKKLRRIEEFVTKCDENNYINK